MDKQYLVNAYPEIAAEWHPTKNKGLNLEEIKVSSNHKVWWRCKKNHEWPSRVGYRTKNKSKCPYCNERLASEINNLAIKFPEIALLWHPTKNGDLKPNDFLPGSNQIVWWQCKENSKHEWKARIVDVTRGSGKCKYCHKTKNIKLPILSKYSPRLVKEWHPTKNKNLTPDMYTAGSPKKVWWQCTNDPSHVWEAQINNRARKGQGCPICVGQVPGNRSLKHLYPEIAAEWHPIKNGNLKPEDVTINKHKKVWWKCSKNSFHEWEAYISSRVKGYSSCPKCEGKKSFLDIYPKVATEWHPIKNNDLTPSQIFHCSQKLYWWKCGKDPSHEWQASAQNRGINKSGCPICRKENLSKELTNNLIESVSTNSKFYENYTESIEVINRLIKIKLNNKQLRRSYLLLLFSNLITLMETYLSDAFINTVINDPKLIRRFVETIEYFKRKITASEIYTWLDNVKKTVTDYLTSKVIYHNIWEVEKMYNSVLDINFPNDMENLKESIIIRHDIVHRNGKTKNGDEIIITINHIKKTAKNLNRFIMYIERQLTEKFQ